MSPPIANLLSLILQAAEEDADAGDEGGSVPEPSLGGGGMTGGTP